MLTGSRLRVIVTGLIAQYPLGGVTWDYLQYVVGLHRMGHDVYYIEDTGQWPYNPHETGVSRGCEFNVAYLRGVMERFGLGERWAYRFPWQSEWFGMSATRRDDVIASADLLLNVSGTLERPDEYRGVARLAYVDSDPVFTQLKLARGQMDFRRLVDAHDVHFSFGEHLTDLVPDTGHHWRPTRQPILLDEWPADGDARDCYTTVMNWTSYKPVEFNGVQYGQKDTEFTRFMDLPSRVEPPLEVAMSVGKTRKPPRDLLTRRGWHIVDPDVVCPDLDSYRAYLSTSRAEWSVAKHGYVAGKPGWFSCRSACYLAAGRPVVVEDTGFRPVLPTGRGLLPFTTLEEAAAAISEVERDYGSHATAARAIAEEYFGSGKVLSTLVDQAMMVGDSRPKEARV